MASEILQRKVQSFTYNLVSTLGRSNRLPATVIGAEHKKNKVVDQSGCCPSPIARKLEKELIKIAPLGTKGIDNFVGCCCEVRSSNQIILKRITIPISAISFTEALRPRTGQIVRRCRNCRQVFG
jgi:hypothetical protein